MAGLTNWLVALTALLPPLAIIVVTAARSSTARRLVAMQFGSGLVALMLAAATFAFAQASSMDLALTLGLLSPPASLLFAVFLERWL